MVLNLTENKTADYKIKIDKNKDAVYPLYGGIFENAKKNQEIFSENKEQNNALVDGRGLLNNNSFSLKKH